MSTDRTSLSIDIDNYTFNLISFNPVAYENRGVVVLNSRNKTSVEVIEFAIYRSHSDLRFWRLCYIANNAEPAFSKGNWTSYIGHYVQTTFIHLELQLFINDALAKNLIPIDETSDCYDIYLKNPATLEKIKHLIDEKTGIRGGLELDFKDYGFIEKTSPQYPYNLLPLGKKDLIANFGYCGSRVKDIQVYNASKFLENNYDFVSNDIIAPYSYTGGDSVNFDLSLNSELCVVTLRKKTAIGGPDELSLYYLKIFELLIVNKLEEDDAKKTKTVNNLYLPVFLGPSINPINEFGLYETYMDLGAYICKLIEYTKNCINKGEKYVCTSHYSLLTDLYKIPLFPFNVIAPESYSVEDFKKIKSMENLLSISKKRTLDITIASITREIRNLERDKEDLEMKEFQVHDHEKLMADKSHNQEQMKERKEQLEYLQNKREELEAAQRKGGKRKKTRKNKKSKKLKRKKKNKKTNKNKNKKSRKK